MTASSTTPTITDYLTGHTIPDVGAESHRQTVLRFLVEEKGYARDACGWMRRFIPTSPAAPIMPRST